LKIVNNAIQEGALGYMIKPIDIPQLIPMIESALARSSEIRKLKASEESLNLALNNSRHISIAIGVIMERHSLIENDSFEILRKYSRSKRIKLECAAEEILNASNSLSFTRNILSELPPTLK
jgi:response regulator NasT